MKYLDLWGRTVVDARNGNELGRIVEICSRNGQKIDEMGLLPADAKGTVIRAQGKGSYLKENFLTACPIEGDAQARPLRRNLPLLNGEGECIDRVADYEFDEQGHCLRILGYARSYEAKTVCIGTQAGIIKDSGQEESKEAPQTVPTGVPARAGEELLGRVAIQEIRNAAGDVVLPKGAAVDGDSLQRSIEEGWLVALATGTARKNH